jgi:hypothetical protein
MMIRGEGTEAKALEPLVDGITDAVVAIFSELTHV